MDLDDDLDVVVSGTGYGFESIMLNNGSGILASPTDNGSGIGGTYQPSVALEDIDLDGDLDMVLVSYNGVSVSLNNTVTDGQGGGTGKRSFTYDPVFN